MGRNQVSPLFDASHPVLILETIGIASFGEN
jgi:hypothetical protein